MTPNITEVVERVERELATTLGVLRKLEEPEEEWPHIGVTVDDLRTLLNAARSERPAVESDARELVANLRAQVDADEEVYTNGVVGQRSRELAFVINRAADTLERLTAIGKLNGEGDDA